MHIFTREDLWHNTDIDTLYSPAARICAFTSTTQDLETKVEVVRRALKAETAPALSTAATAAAAAAAAAAESGLL